MLLTKIQRIGKTGQKVAGRWDADYKEDYNSISAICQSDSKATIDKVEERMIQHFMADPNYKNKLQNEQIGGGEMMDSTVYVVYVVH